MTNNADAEQAKQGPVIRAGRGGDGLPVAEVPSIRQLRNRISVQALIDNRELAPAAADDYADGLVNRYHWNHPHAREVLRVAIVAYLDGYDRGHSEGHSGGYKEGADDALLIGRRPYAPPDDPAPAA